ncbi:SUMF1/EgtB/PvdO family nonheme iron enzyme, partial [Mycobacterium tuberculosis]
MGSRRPGLLTQALDEPLAPNVNERPAHAVTVPSFRMSKTHVTVRQYRACVEAGACAPTHADDGSCWADEGPERAQRPLAAAFRGDD